MKLKEIKAMSLIELLVALAITSFVVLGTFSLILHQRNEKLKLDRKLSTQFVWSQIRLHFIDRKGCENNLKTKISDTISPDSDTGKYTSKFTLNEIKSKNDETLFKVDDSSDYTGITGEGKVKLKTAHVNVDYGTQPPQGNTKQSFWGTLSVVFRVGDKDITKTMSHLNLTVEINSGGGESTFLSCSPWEDLNTYGVGCSGNNEILIAFKVDGAPKCIVAPTKPVETCPTCPNESIRSGCDRFPSESTCRGQKSFLKKCYYFAYENSNTDSNRCQPKRESADCKNNNDCTVSTP